MRFLCEDPRRRKGASRNRTRSGSRLVCDGHRKRSQLTGKEFNVSALPDGTSCLNGGQRVQGKCQCPANFSGSHCQHHGKDFFGVYSLLEFQRNASRMTTVAHKESVEMERPMRDLNVSAPMDVTETSVRRVRHLNQ